MAARTVGGGAKGVMFSVLRRSTAKLAAGTVGIATAENYLYSAAKGDVSQEALGKALANGTIEGVTAGVVDAAAKKVLGAHVHAEAEPKPCFDLYEILDEHNVPITLSEEQRAACDAAEMRMKLETNVDQYVIKRKSLEPLNYTLKPQGLDFRGTGKDYKDALEEALKKIEIPKEKFTITKWGKDLYGKSFSVEWRTGNGAQVNIDWAHEGFFSDGIWQSGPDAPHVGWKTQGKRNSIVGHIIVDEVPVRRSPK